MENLSSKSYERASEELLRFRGIGRKVADCICLMGLHMHSVVPVDTHILQITIENYLPNLTVEKYSQKYRKKITTVWQKKFGPFAGWAQAVLFTAHLRRMGVRPLPKKKSNKGKKE
ncbi:unnamed protein product [Thelazia callipaeda]|uniref:ENDO3c domain-containing protein n=1 Tax=Thelazia callipaeda TaxID=103827 RepID=A0A0N5CPP7_THECL|nr:unnamed protein product [Thelazia callipaeda]